MNEIPETVQDAVRRNFSASPRHAQTILQRIQPVPGRKQENELWFFTHNGLTHYVSSETGQIFFSGYPVSKSDSVHPECTKTTETGENGDVRPPYKQEATGSSPVPPTIESTTSDGFAGAENTKIAQLARDFVHLLCTSGLHGSVTLYPAPTPGVCQSCGWTAPPELHEYNSAGDLVRVRCKHHELQPHTVNLHAVTLRFPEGNQCE